MSMKLLPVEGALVDAMISLADGPWTRQAVERVFVERGWIPADDVGTVRVPWRTDHEFSPWLDLPADVGFEAGDLDGAGWQLYLGAPPPDEDSGEAGAADHSWLALPFALLWPPLAAEGLDADGGGDEDDEEDEDDLDEDFSAEWTRYPDAGPAEFEAEFRRVRALVEDRIGPPTRTVGDITRGWGMEIWDRGMMALTLLIEDNIPSYSHYDHIALGIQLASSVGKLDGIEDARLARLPQDRVLCQAPLLLRVRCRSGGATRVRADLQPTPRAIPVRRRVRRASPGDCARVSAGHRKWSSLAARMAGGGGVH